MKHHLSLIVIALLLSQQVAARPPMPQEGRAAFRKAVEQYQMFVVPHCAPDAVQAYVADRAKRDAGFIRSLRKTDLATDYKQAVADRAETDSRTVYECSGPPPPPPPPPGAASAQPAPPQNKAFGRDTTGEHFAAGDRQFESLVRLRDALIGSPGK